MARLQELVAAALNDLSARISAIERICGIVAQSDPKCIDSDTINAISRAFATWAAGIEYWAGETVDGTAHKTDIVQYDGKLYKCCQHHTAVVSWEPNAVPALWTPIDVLHAGTIADPIPAAVGMQYERNKFYIDGDVLYHCIRDDSGSGTTLYYMPSQLVGDYFEVVLM